MAILQIFAGKKTGTKKGLVRAFGDWFDPPNDPYVQGYDFQAVEYGCEVGSTIVNLATGDTTTVTGFLEYISIDKFTTIFLADQIFNAIDEPFTVQVDSNNSDIDYTELDLFKDETIELTQNTKDFKDVSKVLTDYTQSFKVPASKVNNRYFEHY